MAYKPVAHKPTVTKYLIRIYIVLSLLIITPAGFILKSHSGIGRWWFNNHGAGVLYDLPPLEKGGRGGFPMVSGNHRNVSQGSLA